MTKIIAIKFDDGSEAEQIAAWIVEQGKIAAGKNVVKLRGKA